MSRATVGDLLWLTLGCRRPCRNPGASLAAVSYLVRHSVADWDARCYLRPRGGHRRSVGGFAHLLERPNCRREWEGSQTCVDSEVSLLRLLSCWAEQCFSWGRRQPLRTVLTRDSFVTPITFEDGTQGQCLTEVYAAHGMPSGNPQYLEADLTTTGMQGTGDFVTTTDFDCRVSELTVDATYNDQEGVRREVSASALAGNYVHGMFDGYRDLPVSTAL